MVVTKVITADDNAIDVEAFGIFEAVSFIQARHLNKVVIESDNLMVVTAIKHRNFTKNYWGKCLKKAMQNLRRWID